MGRMKTGARVILLISISIILAQPVASLSLNGSSAEYPSGINRSSVSGDPRGSHRSDFEIIHTNPRIEYLAYLGEGGAGSSHAPLISDSGNLFLAANSTLTCFDTDGMILWSANPMNGSAGSISGPAMSGDGGIFVLDSEGFLHRFDQEGGPIWKEKVHGGGECSDRFPVINGNRIYITGIDGRVGCYDLDGSEIWTRDLVGSRISNPSVNQNDTVAVSYDGSVSGIAYIDRDGQYIWRNESLTAFIGDPVIDDIGGIISVMESDLRGPTLSRFHSNGSLDWIRELPSGSRGKIHLSLDFGGNIHAASRSGIITTFNVNGGEIWDLLLTENITGPCTSTADGYLLVPTESRLIAVNDRGDKAGEVGTGNPIGSLSMISNGTGYCAYGYLMKAAFTMNQASSQIEYASDLTFDEDMDYRIEMSDIFTEGGSSVTHYGLIPDDENILFEMVDADSMLIFGSPDHSGTAAARLSAVTPGEDGLFNTSDDVSARSNIFLVDILPVNDPPVLLNGDDLPDAVVGEEYVYELTVDDIDSDPDYMTLIITTGEWLGVKGRSLYSERVSKSTGPTHIGLLVTDEDGGSSEYNLEINVVGGNSPPYVRDYNFYTMKEDSTITIEVDQTQSSAGRNEISIWDDDGDDITYEIEPGPDMELVRKLPDSFVLKPVLDFFGETYFDIILSDGTDRDETRLEVNIYPEEDNVRDLVIVLETPEDEVKSGELTVFRAYFKDPDEGSQYSGNYDFNWYSDLDGNIGHGVSIESMLSPGTHNISLVANKYHSDHPDVVAYLEIDVAGAIDTGSGEPLKYHDADSKGVMKQTWIIVSFILISFTVIPLLFVGGQALWNWRHKNIIPEKMMAGSPRFRRIDDRGGGPA
ncbi:MAG: PQQ-binding-like beta-propeller repeat protein [Thermoplasmatota archaeon]